MLFRIRMFLIVALLGLMTLVMLPLQLLAIRFKPPLAGVLPMLWHRAAMWLVGVRIHVVGSPSRERPVMLAANHASWSDIPVLGAVLPCSFIAKDDMIEWPIFGLLAKLQRTVFVARRKPQASGEQADEIAARMIAGDAIVLFAEGTTSCGNFVMPFKSSLFGAPQRLAKGKQVEAVYVQPVAIHYSHLHGLPMGRYLMPHAAWPGDIELIPHLANFVAKGAFDVEVRFGAPHRFDGNANRKAFAAAVEQEVRDMLSAAKRGKGLIDAAGSRETLHSGTKSVEDPQPESGLANPS